MRVLALFNSKGGSGKSTLAMHLGVAAAERLRVVILDADPNGTTTVWSGARNLAAPPAVEPTSAVKLRAHLEILRAAGIDLVILDCPPTITADSARLVSFADFVIVPVQPTMPDVAGCYNATKIISAQKVPFAFVISRCPTPSADTRDAIDGLAETAEVCPVVIGDRIAFSRALASGMAVTEYERDTKACREIVGACEWMLDKVGVQSHVE